MESIEENVYSGVVWVEFTIDPRRLWKCFFCLFFCHEIRHHMITFLNP